MSDPDFVAQTAEPMTRDERLAWFQERNREFKERGATWAQYSVDDADNPKIALFEGWLVRPKEQPAPHFQMMASDSGGE